LNIVLLRSVLSLPLSIGMSRRPPPNAQSLRDEYDEKYPIVQPVLQRQHAVSSSSRSSSAPPLPTPPPSPQQTSSAETVHWDICTQLNLGCLVSVCVCAHVDEFCQDLVDSCSHGDSSDSEEL